MVSTSATKTIDYDRLTNLLGMLGSEHIGERDTAARMATTLIKEAGTT